MRIITRLAAVVVAAACVLTHVHAQGAAQSSLTPEQAAFKELRDAALKGNVDAEFKLGSVYYTGTAIVKKDFVESAKWFKLAAAAGHAGAAFCLAAQYAAGEGMPQDYTEAMRWYRQAAMQNDATAYFRIGEMYANGQGVHKDDTEAFKYYKLAADRKDGSGQFTVGLAYSEGRGVARNYAEAAKWYRLSAGQGNWGAMINLALLYSTGVGVTRDYVQAHMWFSVAGAISAGNDRAQALRARDDVAKAMTAAQLADAASKAKACQQSQFVNCG